ncbi:MAG: hypothetical protein ABIK62_04330, partial [candidate division WOR-3 bacterium]
GLRFRIPILGSALSALVPGLGQVYAGRVGDGLYSLLVVGTSAGLAYYYWKGHQEQDPTYIKFVLATSLGTLFHLGNVYGASIAARDYNRHIRSEYAANIERLLGRFELAPDYSSVLQN